MKFQTLRRTVAPAAMLAFGLAVSGCATNNIDRFGQQTTGTELLLFRNSRTMLNEDAARANVIAAGMANPNPIVSNYAANVGCDPDSPAGTTVVQRIQRREDWAAVAGEQSACPAGTTRRAPAAAPAARTPGQP